MKVLVIWPPHVPSYFNAGHHTPLYMMAGHLRRQPSVEQVDVRDAGVLNTHWKAIGDLLYQGQYDVIAMMNDFDAVDGFDRFTAYARELSPNSRLITFGRLSSMNPGFFQRYGLDAIVQSGDYEPGVARYIESVAAGTPHDPLPGVTVRRGEEWAPPAREGDSMPSEEWVLPDVREIPYEHYDRLYARDEDKFCGIPFRRELVVPAARGCPIGCEFCEVHEIFGLRERRLSVDATVAYIEESMRALPFEYVAFYAPTFTLDKRWVRELCERFLAGPVSPQWKCATTIHHLDADLVELMGRAGCVRISVGLETLEPDGHGALPRAKRIHGEGFGDLAAQCARAGIELNAFVIVGLPGTGAEGARRTRELVEKTGARFRPTMYTRLHDMTPSMTPLEISRYNRHLIADPDHAPDDDLYDFIFGRETRVTSVYERIPLASARGKE